MRQLSLLLVMAGWMPAANIPSRFASMPFAFEPNRGQADGSVRFLARCGAQDAYLTGSGLITSGVTLRLQGGNPGAATTGLDPLPGRHNYFHGVAARTDIPTFRRVRYAQVYPGVDVIFHGDQGSLEYDFRIAPGADPARIRLRWEGARSVQLDAAGDLVIETPRGELQQRRPVVYQERDGRRIAIAGSYALTAHNEARFSLGAYDRSRALVIDPVLFAMDSSLAAPSAMAVDPTGNIYLTGSTQTSILPATSRAAQPAFGGGTCLAFGFFGGPSMFPCPDVYVMKLDPAGDIVYVTYLGGTGFDYGYAIAADAAGNAYVTGTSFTNTAPNNFPTTLNAAYPQPSAGSIDGFVAKLSPAGDKLVYSTYLPGADTRTIALDLQGNAYVAGGAASTGFPATPGAYQSRPLGPGRTGVVAKLNASGSALVYATYLGGSGSNTNPSDGVSGIAVDSSGNAFLTGFTTSPDFPTTPGAFQARDLNQGGAAFVVKLNASGSAALYATLLGGSRANRGQRVKIDAQGNAYVLGTTESSDFPVAAGAFQSTGPSAPWSLLPNISGFLSKLDPAGAVLVYSTYLSGATDLDVDAGGNAYVLGGASYGFPVTPGAPQACMNGGGADVLAAQFTPDGKLAGATYLGGSGRESAYALVAATDGSVYITGSTTSTDFPGIVGASAIQGLTFTARVRLDNPQQPHGPCLSLSVQNGATFLGGPIVGGEIVTLRGTGLGPEEPAFRQIGPDGKVTTTLAGVQVFFNQVPAPLLYVQSQQINAVVPWEIVSLLPGVSPILVRVVYNGVSSNTVPASSTTTAPGVFLTDFTSRQAAAMNEDGTLNAPGNPARRGSVIAIFGTGGGPTTPAAGVTGGLWPADPLVRLIAPVSVRIADLGAELLYAGSAPGQVTGVFQINVRVPDNARPSPAASIELTIGGASIQQNSRTIAIQ